MLPFTLLAAVPLFFGASLLLGANDDCCEVDCHRCGESFCHPVPKEVTVSRHCWEVEWKQVCIPAVRWPWQRWFSNCDGCDGGGCNACSVPCGRTRWVRVLKKRKYDCTKCGCDWVIAPLCDDCTAASPLPVDDGVPLPNPARSQEAPVVPPAPGGSPPPPLDAPDAASLRRGRVALPGIGR
jgi:hypothetical protein